MKAASRVSATLSLSSSINPFSRCCLLRDVCGVVCFTAAFVYKRLGRRREGCGRKTIVLLVSNLCVTACISEDQQQSEQIGGSLGGSYAQCVNHPPGAEAGLAEVTITIDRLVPAEAEIRCSDKQAFSFEGRKVSLIYVAYGAQHDCPAGCFSSHVCSVYDPDEVQLYSFSWHGAEERPLSIPSDCPELSEAESGNESLCSTPPSGVIHPVTATAEFEAFRSAQREQDGSWRFCF